MNRKHALERILGVAAHPDDLEFGCGAILLQQRNSGVEIHWLVCSRGESGSHGTPEIRRLESEAAAEIVGATLHWCDLGGDAQISFSCEHANIIAEKIRAIKPQMLLAPTPHPNQHPDHYHVSNLTRDAARLARYGGLERLKGLDAHSIETLLFYEITSGSSANFLSPLAFDVSDVAQEWKQLMECHQSQLKTRDYVQYQLDKARVLGRECGTEYVQRLFAQESVVLTKLSDICGSARAF